MKSTANLLVNWIKNYYKDNPSGKAIIGISGGKDSTICAALLVKALGADRVVCALLPNGKDKDKKAANAVINYLKIPSDNVITMNILDTYESVISKLGYVKNEEPDTIATNLPARLRMAYLYTIASLYPNSRVVNTSNLSESYVGYATKFGDTAGDFSPLSNLTVREVIEIGDELDLPYDLVHKEPTDGMSGVPDELRLGFTYDELDSYLLGTDNISEETIERIEYLHKINLHKLEPMPKFNKNEK